MALPSWLGPWLALWLDASGGWVVLLHSDASWVLLRVAYGCVALWQVFMITV
jgi:hypothetical protein